MALVTLTNPGGLDLAVLGNPGARRTTMRRRTYRRPARAISRRRNPTAFQSRMASWNAARDAKLKRSKAAKKAAATRKRNANKRSVAAKKAAKTRARRSGTTSIKRVTRTGSRPTKKGKSKMANKRKSPKRVAAGKKAARTRKRRASARRRNTRTGRTYKARGPKRTVKIRKTIVRKPGSKRYGKKRAYAKRRGMGWTGKKGTRSYKAQVYRKGRRGSRIVRFTNPGSKMTVANYAKGLTSAPGNVMAALRGRHMIKNSLFIGGGAIGTYLAGGFITAKISPMLARIPGAGQFLAGDMGKRIVGGLMPYTLGFVASRFVKGADTRRALVTGGAVASIVSVLFPNAMDRLIARLGIGAAIPPATTEGFGAYQALAGHFGDSTMLAGYVQAPAYAGVQGYVEAPAYSGVQGYVEAPAYSGVGDDALGGYLDSSYMNSSYLAGV